jgi:hypothetical protein
VVRHIPHALTTGILGIAVTYFSQHPSVNIALWPCLIGWAVYMLVGANPVNGIRALANLLFGGIVAVGVFKLGTALTATTGTWALPIAVGAAFFVMSMTHQIQYLNLPVYQLVGAGTFFGMGYNADITNVFQLGLVVAAGMVFSYINFHARERVSKMLRRPSPWPNFRKENANFSAGKENSFKKAA